MQTPNIATGWRMKFLFHPNGVKKKKNILQSNNTYSRKKKKWEKQMKIDMSIWRHFCILSTKKTMVKYITLNISFFLASILLPRTLMVQLLGNFNVFKGHFESLSNYMFKSKVKGKNWNFNLSQMMGEKIDSPLYCTTPFAMLKHKLLY